MSGDYANRVRTAEDRLVESVHDRLIDADRLVRERRWQYGLPVWSMYRAAYCGDTHCVGQVKRAAVWFAAVFGESGGVRSDARSDELYGIAGLDAVYRLLYGDWMISDREGARLTDVNRDTYARFRNTIWRVMDAILRDYWGELLAGYASLARDYRE